MPKETPTRKKTVERVMHEFKHGELKGRDGQKVKNPRQAIAIGLSEAGASNRKTPAENRRDAAHTRAKERKGRTAQQEREGAGAMQHNKARLYAEAKRLHIPGRSKMNKAQLAHALRHG